MLEKQRGIAVATLNRLLHRKAEAELPPPPSRLAVERSAQPLPASQDVVAQLRERRPQIDRQRLDLRRLPLEEIAQPRLTAPRIVDQEDGR